MHFQYFKTRLLLFKLRLIIVSDVILFDVMQSTVVFKTKLHCEGCEHKIKRIVSKINGAFIIYP